MDANFYLLLFESLGGHDNVLNHASPPTPSLLNTPSALGPKLMVAQILEYLDGKELFVRIVESEEDITEAHIADFIQLGLRTNSQRISNIT